MRREEGKKGEGRGSFCRRLLLNSLSEGTAKGGGKGKGREILLLRHFSDESEKRRKGRGGKKERLAKRGALWIRRNDPY